MKNLFLLFFVLSLLRQANAQITTCINAPTNYSLSSGYTYPEDIADGDYDQDGKKDLVVLNSGGGGRICVFKGLGTGNFTLTQNYSPLCTPLAVTSTDYNNDGKPDFVIICQSSNLASIYLGTGLGTFMAPTQFSIGVSPYDIVSADINGDGNKDLVTINGTNISFILGLGNGSFSAPTSFTTSTTPYSNSSITSGDLNGDGKDDIIVGNNAGPNKVLGFLGTASGSLTPAFSFTMGISLLDLAMSDLNGDNTPDLIVTGDYQSHVFLNSGSGILSYSAEYISHTNARKVTVTDVNGDGIKDFAVLSQYTGGYFGNGVSVFLGTGGGLFNSIGAYPTEYNSCSITSSDFNNDGKMDLAIVNRNSYNITMLKGAAMGIESLPYYTFNFIPAKIISDDFNGDGNKDFASVSTCCMGHYSILLGTNNGRVFSVKNFTLATGPTALTSADFNNDGKKDIAAANYNDHKISILTGNGNGTFVNSINYPVYAPLDLTVADFNNDGNVDIVSTEEGSSIHWIRVYLGAGNGTFAAQNSYTVGAFKASSITTGDFNLDGNMDISVALTNLSNNVGIFFGTGSGTFNNMVTYNVQGLGRLVTSTDINSDGKPDLIASATGTNCVSVLIGSGTGSFSLSTTYTLTSGLGSLTSGDLNNDGHQDLIATRGGVISVLYGSGANLPTQFSDINTPFYAADVVSHDYNNDGKKDLAIASSGPMPSIVLVSNETPNTTILSYKDSVCIGESIILSGGGATSYAWSTGQTTSTINISPSVTTTYTLTGSSFSGCSNSAAKTISVTPHSLPQINVQVGSSVVCLNTSSILNASGATSYSWATGAITASISVSPTITTSYSVTGTDLNNCSATQTVAVTVNPNCQDVWPGDANSDGVADNFDVLELGLHFTQTGPARTTTSNAWQSYFANNWTGAITNGKNVNHSDCNGDGTINNNDTLAIFNNYGLMHAFKPTRPTALNPQLSIVPDQNAVAKGAWGTSSVFLGETSTPISNINGLAFTVAFDQNLIDANSFYIEYPASFINAGNQNLDFSKPDFTNGKLYTATTHTITNNVNGNGKIAVLHYKIKSTLATDEVLNISIISAKQSNANGVLTPLTAGTATVAAIGASVGMNELSTGSSIALYPNPANASATIQSSAILEKIEVLSLTGQTILSETASGNQYLLDLSTVANGVYFVVVSDATQKVTRKKLVVQR